MQTPTFRVARFALPLAFGLAACGDDGGPSSEPCSMITDYAIGSAVGGDLSDSDCFRENGSNIDLYALEATSQVSVEFRLSSGAFDALLFLYAPGNPISQVLAFHDDIDDTNTNSRIHILMAPDSYFVGASSFAAGQSGSYTLSSTIFPADNNLCAEVWVTTGVTTSQMLETDDCVDVGPIFSDEFSIVLLAGQTFTGTMTSLEVSPRLVLLDGSGATVAGDLGGADAILPYTVTTDDRYTLVATSDTDNETGAYDLTIQVAT